jgi:hypothetical protein
MYREALAAQYSYNTFRYRDCLIGLSGLNSSTAPPLHYSNEVSQLVPCRQKVFPINGSQGRIQLIHQLCLESVPNMVALDELDQPTDLLACAQYQHLEFARSSIA